MIKWLYKKIKSFYNNEYEGKIVIEFTIYDVAAFVVILSTVLWMLTR